MANVRGLRSSNDAKPWRCRCGKVNRPTKHRFFDLPAFQCRRCRKKYDGNFKFCLGEIEVEGGSLIGEVKDQKKTPYCIAYAYCKALEISERVFNVNNQIDPNEVECINPKDLQEVYEEKFPNFAAADSLIRDYGIHKLIHMGLILREEGIEGDKARKVHKADDLSAIPRDDFEEIARLLAEGIPLLATYHVGKRRSHLKYCQIYKSPPREQGQKYYGHAVVLIGAGTKNGQNFFYFLNSWGKQFCPRKNTRGEIKLSGIGKIRVHDLTKNVIKLSQPHKTDAGRRLEAQNEADISKENYFLMMATKKQYASITSRKAKLANDFDKIREDHLIHGAFCDDEAEYFQASEDRYDEPEACSTEMEGHLVEEDFCDKLHRDQSASAQTNHATHSARGIAQPATSGAPASTSHRASRTPSSGPGAGGAQGATRSGPAGNIRNSATVGLGGLGSAEFSSMLGGLTGNATAGTTGARGGLGSADMGCILGCLPDASPLTQIVQNPAIMQIIMSDPQSVNQLLSINTNASNRVESNNQTREMFQNPEFLHKLKSPEILQTLSVRSPRQHGGRRWRGGGGGRQGERRRGRREDKCQT